LFLPHLAGNADRTKIRRAIRRGLSGKRCPLPMYPLRMQKLRGAVVTATIVIAMTAPGQALAERIANPVAEFSGIDKITGRIITFDVYINETVQFGALQVTPRVCYSRPETEEPKTDSFVEVDEITLD